MPQEFDFCIIGAGVIGCAVAAAIRDLGTVCILEKNEAPCLEISGNNSGVIHPGFNHPLSTLKAKLCVEGNGLLYEYCRKRNIPHLRCGTYVLSFDEEEEQSMQQLWQNAAELQVALIERKPGEVNRRAIRAFFAPQGGVVDVHALCTSLLNDSAAMLHCDSKVIGLADSNGHWSISTPEQTYASRFLINAAGLYADEVSSMAGYPGYRIYPCSGEYYEIQDWQAPHLYYPAPHTSAGLGIHLTPTTRGTTLIGPTATFLDRKQDQRRFFDKEDFVRAAELLYPGCTQYSVKMAHRGIRPKLSDVSFQDFVIRKEKKALIQLIGIDSPGLTSCLSIANKVRSLLA
jgi:glycerol-3-phosphate dehydrogenase